MSLDTTFLKKRGHSWSFYMAVPKALHDKIGKRHIVKSLGTRDLTEAQRLRWQLRVEWEKRFAKLQGAPLKPTIDDDLSPREAYLSRLSHVESVFSIDELDQSRDRIIEQAIDEAKELDERGHPIDVRPSLVAELDAVDDELVARKKGKRPTRPEYSLSISGAAERYLAREAKDGDDHQRLRQYRRTLEHFAEFTNDKPLKAVTREDTGQFIGILETLDRNWGKSPKDRHLSFSQLVSRYANQSSPLSDRTINRHLSALRGLWDWGQKVGELDSFAPLDGLFRKPRRQDTKRSQYQSFTPEELLALFGPPRAATSEVVEIALVGLYTGMRLEEIVSLGWQDVKQEQDITYFDIAEAKSVAGIRRVPAHSHLDWLLRRNEGSGPVWPRLAKYRDTSAASQAISKRFATYRRRHGFDESRKLVFHSLRKSFSSQLFAAHVQEAEIAQIVGHENKNITSSVYNPRGFSLKQSKDNVEKFKIEGLVVPDILELHASR